MRELIGPRDLSYREATRIPEERICKPDLAYAQLPYEDMVDALLQAGLSKSFYVEMTRSFNGVIVQPRNARTPENTTPTTFEQFASEFALAYKAVFEQVA